MPRQPAPGKPASANRDLAPSGEPHRIGEKLGLVSFAQVGLFAIAAIYALHHGRPLIFPLVLALLSTLLLKPLQHRLERVSRLPGPLAAVGVMAVFITGVILGLTYLATPASQYASQLRQEIVQNRLRTAFKPIAAFHNKLTDVAEKVENITSTEAPPGIPVDSESVVSIPLPAGPSGGGGPIQISAEDAPVDEAAPPKPAPVEVEIHENHVGSLYTYAQEFSVQAVITFTMVFFLLIFGDRMIQRLGEVAFAAKLLEDISRDVSHYLLTISAINAGLGVATAIAMALLGMPNPMLWGVMAAFLNFIPYIGAIAGSAIVCLVAAISFERPVQILPVPMVYYALTAIEGYFITPTIIGRRFTVSPIIVFVWVIAWGALWGVPGMLIALPLLMVFRIICAKVPALSRVEGVLSA